jgi:hypothetical protein
LSWVCKELLKFVPVFIFFLIFFTLINWTESFLFKKAGITPFGFVEIALAAALIAKVIFFLDYTPFVRFFEKRPLIYNILWRTALYWISLLTIRILIRFIPFVLGAKNGFDRDVQLFMEKIDWRLFFSIQVDYLMLLFIFDVFKGLSEKIGYAEMRRIFLGK